MESLLEEVECDFLAASEEKEVALIEALDRKDLPRLVLVIVEGGGGGGGREWIACLSVALVTDLG